VSVTPQEETRLRGARSVDPEAYETYLKGRHLIEQRTESHLRSGLALLEQSVKHDEKLALAHVGIADAYNLMGFMSVMPSRESFPRAQAAARRALEVDPASGEAYTSLAYAALWHDWDLDESERLFRRAVDLDPKYSQAHLWFTNHLMVAGRFEEADAEARLARILDPHSNVAIAFTGWHPYWQGRHEEARRRLLGALEQIPGFGALHYWLGLSCMRGGRDAEAMAAFTRCAGILGRTPMVISGLATAHALAGRRAEALEHLRELEELGRTRYVGPYHFAQVHTALGEHDRAFELLEQAVSERVHWMAALHMDPSFAALREDPRFTTLVARVRAIGTKAGPHPPRG
jgi:tetratricopeptide (TPR) repeat protein